MRPSDHKTKGSGQKPREIHAAPRKIHAAFTIIELLVVVALSAILFVMIIPTTSHGGF